jgi:hypothetical protein
LEEERTQILNSLSQDQINFITNLKRFKQESDLYNKILSKDEDYELQDIVIDYNYPESKLLYCECGRHLKYQFIVKGTEGNTLKLGETHLHEITNIDNETIKRFRHLSNAFKLNIDRILINILDEIKFPHDLYDSILNHKEYEKLSDKSKKLINKIRDFKSLDLPIYNDYYKRLELIQYELKQKSKDAYVLEKTQERQDIVEFNAEAHILNGRYSKAKSSISSDIIRMPRNTLIPLNELYGKYEKDVIEKYLDLHPKFRRKFTIVNEHYFKIN